MHYLLTPCLTIFNAKWTIDGAAKKNSLFHLIKETTKQSPNGIISAYKDNAAITDDQEVDRLHLKAKNHYSFVQDKLNSTIKVETHNHPTAISPWYSHVYIFDFACCHSIQSVFKAMPFQGL